ncbi:MAG: FeoB-associated Cys-rich membrane protein [Clostridia bacterium]|nr:FeoB-associated Cys-rich membrane protein [Clostridia bacterium]
MDWIIIAVVVLFLAFAVWQVVRRKKGKCSGCCGGCNGQCGKPVKKKTD